jgi:hypothetical protein
MRDDTREAVHERDRGQCANCRASGPDVTLDVHHIVPRGRGGSNRMSNLILLCRQCHDAAHEQATAPTVDFRSTGNMSSACFGTMLEFFRELPTARFDSDEKVWRIPKADFQEEVIREVSESAESAIATDGGER